MDVITALKNIETTIDGMGGPKGAEFKILFQSFDVVKAAALRPEKVPAKKDEKKG